MRPAPTIVPAPGGRTCIFRLSDERRADLRPPVLRAGNRSPLDALPLPTASISCLDA